MSQVETMQAIGFDPDGPLRLVTLPVPVPDDHQVLIRMHAAGINRPDLLQRMGGYPPPPGASLILGLEMAGEIVALGASVQRWRIGDRVTALLSGGGYAQFALADAGSCLPLPRGLDFVQAASLPETLFTVWTNVFERGALAKGENLLIHGATSGIGVAAIQMAKAFGARVFATAGSDTKVAFARELGADRAIHYRNEDFSTIVQDLGGADVVLDMVGGPYLAANIACMNRDARLLYIAFLMGAMSEINLMPIMLKRLTLTGSTLRARPDMEKARIAAAVEANVWPWLENKQMKAVIDSTFPLAEAEAAHARMLSGEHIGKIVLVG